MTTAFGGLTVAARPRPIPVGTRNGRAHVRLEVLDRPPPGAPTTWTICDIPNRGKGNGYGCTGTPVHREAGVHERDVPMAGFREDRSIVWEEGIKDDSGGRGHAHRRSDPERVPGRPAGPRPVEAAASPPRCGGG